MCVEIRNKFDILEPDGKVSAQLSSSTIYKIDDNVRLLWFSIF